MLSFDLQLLNQSTLHKNIMLQEGKTEVVKFYKSHNWSKKMN
jgi:hypothetical protein